MFRSRGCLFCLSRALMPARTCFSPRDRRVNVTTGPRENRLLLTGLHVVADIYCNCCDTRLGWKYLEAYEETQKYKEGKFILEKAMIGKEEEIPSIGFREQDVTNDAIAVQ
mmetsp:Transcript_10010/g.27192  ORF Transcript_10010/g.27192 Transcript_10010/m.27192 type:complete len:111 (+) Transcript_10010:311-643(+)